MRVLTESLGESLQAATGVADGDLTVAIQGTAQELANTMAEDELELAFLAEDFTKLLTSLKIGTERIHEIVRSLRNSSITITDNGLGIPDSE